MKYLLYKYYQKILQNFTIIINYGTKNRIIKFPHHVTSFFRWKNVKIKILKYFNFFLKIFLFFILFLTIYNCRLFLPLNTYNVAVFISTIIQNNFILYIFAIITFLTISQKFLKFFEILNFFFWYFLLNILFIKGLMILDLAYLQQTFSTYSWAVWAQFEALKVLNFLNFWVFLILLLVRENFNKFWQIWSILLFSTFWLSFYLQHYHPTIIFLLILTLEYEFLFLWIFSYIYSKSILYEKTYRKFISISFLISVLFYLIFIYCIFNYAPVSVLNTGTTVTNWLDLKYSSDFQKNLLQIQKLLTLNDYINALIFQNQFPKNWNNYSILDQIYVLQAMQYLNYIHNFLPTLDINQYLITQNIFSINNPPKDIISILSESLNQHKNEIDLEFYQEINEKIKTWNALIEDNRKIFNWFKKVLLHK